MNIEALPISFLSIVALLSLALLTFSRQEGPLKILTHLVSLAFAILLLIAGYSGWALIFAPEAIGSYQDHTTFVAGVLFLGIASAMFVGTVRETEFNQSLRWAASFLTIFLAFCSAYIGYLLFSNPTLISQNMISTTLLGSVCFGVSGVCFFIGLLK